MIKSAFAEVDETKSCTIVYEKGCCDEVFGQRLFVMLTTFFVTHALIYISKRNLTNHTWCVEFVSRFATHMSLLTNNTIKVKNEYLHLLSFQTNSVYAELIFCEMLKTLIISGSKIVETSSELIWTSSELISTIAELISTIAESFLEIARSVAQQWQTDGKSKVLFLMYFYYIEPIAV